MEGSIDNSKGGKVINNKNAGTIIMSRRINKVR